MSAEWVPDTPSGSPLALADLDAAGKPSDLDLPGLSPASAEGRSEGILEPLDFRQLADHLPL